ncbi:MAG: TROVE domain-containing protein, partial [Candidatus Brocadiia bacterium]
MGTALRKARKVTREQRLPSKDVEATVNRAGGVSFDIKDPATKLITMTGGSFFAEPRFYSDETCVPARLPDGTFDKLDQRLQTIRKGASEILTVNACEELDTVAQDIINTAWAILSGKNPKDLFVIAHWLRQEMNIRLTPQVLLVLASRHPAGQPFVREYAPKIVSRPDEVKTCILLHRFFFGHKVLKNCLSAGLADVISKVGERGLLKYEGSQYPSWKDVLMVVKRHKDFPLPKAQDEYFRYGRISEEGTPIAYKRKLLTECDSFGVKAKKLVKESLANWEVVLSQFGHDKDSKSAVWEYLIREGLVGYMALMRNLCNLLKADISDDVVKLVVEKLSNRNEVLKSRQLPFRFASAYAMVSQAEGNSQKTRKFLDAIEDALDISCDNVMEIPGSTAIFVDNSGSMDNFVSEKSKVSCKMAGNVLAGMFAKRSKGDVWVCAFGNDVAEVRITKRSTVMSISKNLSTADTKGWSTNAYRCPQWLIEKGIKPDRVVLISDMQCWDSRGWGCDGKQFCDEWKRFKQTRKDSWLHSVNVQGYGDAVVKENSGNVILVGAFSE